VARLKTERPWFRSGDRRAATGRGERGGQYLGLRARLARSIAPDGVLSGTILAPLVLPFFAIA
jgi:hypothetical protein